MSKNKSVLIADDHEAVVVGLKSVLQNVDGYEVVAEASTGEAAYELYTSLYPEIIILDISMPGIGGIEAIRKIRARNKNPLIIVYTMHDETIHVRQALEAGALAYILKSDPVVSIISALKKTMDSGHYLSEVIAQKLAIESVSGNIPSVEKLTAREYEVFCFLARGLKVNEIAELLAISSKTVATYQTQLKQKLEISNSIDLVKLAMKSGVI